MTKDIFITYRRADSSSFAARLRDRLEQTFPDQVFLDVSGIDAGEDFIDRLGSAVLASKVVVAVIGPAWAARQPGQPALGESGDVVTQEIGTALEAEIPIVPVLIDGARMPAPDDLPPRLRTLPRRNAVSISHERFESDATHLIAAIYRPLGIAPPNRFERMLELVGRTRVTQRSRDQCALWSMATTVLALLSLAGWVVISDQDPLELPATLAVAGLALALGILGRHSHRRHGMAVASIVIASVTLVSSVGLGAWRSASSLADPWLLAEQLADEYKDTPELPADRIAWSSRPPFEPPYPPSVECDCLRVGNQPTGPAPYAAGTSVTLTNACADRVTIALSRSQTPLPPPASQWFAFSGRDFAVVILAPRQAAHVPVAGTAGVVSLPWVCQQERPPGN